MSTYGLKILAIISMTIDHLFKVFPFQNFSYNYLGIPYEITFFLIEYVGILGRLALPLFAFCVAESCKHTRSPLKYLSRLFIVGVFSELPYQVAFHPEYIHLGLTNVMFTFFFGALSCFGFHLLHQKQLRVLSYFPLLLCLALSAMLKTDYNIFGVLLVFASFVASSKKSLLILFAGILTILYLGYASLGDPVYVLFWLNPNHQNIFFNHYTLNWFSSLLSLVFIWKYNSQKGQSKKWLFYLYYPTHLLVLKIVSSLII